MITTVPTASLATRTGARLLAMAADLLPAMVGAGPVLSSDVHASLVSAARSQPWGDDLARAHLVADQAEEMFADYLLATGEARPGRSVSNTVRGWTAGAPVWAVTRGLQAASRYFVPGGLPRR